MIVASSGNLTFYVTVLFLFNFSVIFREIVALMFFLSSHSRAEIIDCAAVLCDRICVITVRIYGHLTSTCLISMQCNSHDVSDAVFDTYVTI